MNETFNINRFWTYFQYDLKQMWRNHSKAAILIGGASAIIYVVWVLGSLVFAQRWTAPPMVARAIIFGLAYTILIIYTTYTYGHLTEKKAGSSWLMIPASKAEKFVSMLLITLFVIPLLFFAVYFLIDGFLSLVDPTYGQALATGISGLYSTAINLINNLGSESPVIFTPSSLVFPTIISVFYNFLFFLLCGICFKKNKIVGAFAILFGLSMASSLLMGLIVPQFVGNVNFDPSDEQIVHWVVNIMNGSTILSCLITIGLGWGVWYRIKTIQH